MGEAHSAYVGDGNNEQCRLEQPHDSANARSPLLGGGRSDIARGGAQVGCVRRWQAPHPKRRRGCALLDSAARVLLGQYCSAVQQQHVLAHSLFSAQSSLGPAAGVRLPKHRFPLLEPLAGNAALRMHGTTGRAREKNKTVRIMVIDALCVPPFHPFRWVRVPNRHVVQGGEVGSSVLAPTCRPFSMLLGERLLQQ